MRIGHQREYPNTYVFGFFCPNGAGKSTTILLLLVGMIEPTEGKCIINEIEVARNPLKVKEIISDWDSQRHCSPTPRCCS